MPKQTNHRGKYIIGHGFSLRNTEKGERKREKVVVVFSPEVGQDSFHN